MATFLGMLDCRRPSDITPNNNDTVQLSRVDHRYAKNLQQQIEASQRSFTPNKVNKLELASSRLRADHSRSISPFQTVTMGNQSVIGSNQQSYHRPYSPFKQSIESVGWQQQSNSIKEASFNLARQENTRPTTILSSNRKYSTGKDTLMTVILVH
jgi:hypothetical protein